MVPSVDSMASELSRVKNGCLRDELKGPKRKISLTNCGVCGSEEARYRCPGCLKHSCSLPCVKKHKQDSGCSGVRDKTAFVALSQFDEMNLLSDYRFLEDTGRKADSANRDKLIRSPLVNQSKRSKLLSAQARGRNMTLRFLPITFTKSRENSTYFVYKTKQILWHLKLLFPQSEAEFVEERISEDKTLEQILTLYIHPTESEPVRRQKLKRYVRSPFDQVKIFMRAEGRKANSVRYQELSLTKSLRDNLRYKTVIEYPVLHVVLADNCQDYPLKGPAAPVASHNRPAVEHKLLGNGPREWVLDVPRPHPGPGGLGGTAEPSPEVGHPKEKRLKREAVAEELEDGEIEDSEDDAEEEETADGHPGDEPASRKAESTDVEMTECPGEGEPQPSVGGPQPSVKCLGEGERQECLAEGEPQECSGEGDSQECSGEGNPQEYSGEGEPHECSGEGEPQECSGEGDPQECSGEGEPQECSGEGDPQECSGEGEPQECLEEGNPQECSGEGKPQECLGEENPQVCVGEGNPQVCLGEGNPKECSGEGKPQECLGEGNPQECLGEGEPQPDVEMAECEKVGNSLIH